VKKTSAALVAAFLAVPTLAQAQDMFSPSFTPMPGFYVGAGGGAEWLLGTTTSPNGQQISSSTGWAVGGKAGYDFVGPRAELEVSYGQAYPNISIPGTAINGKAGQLTAMANLLYDFMPSSLITPYVGAGAGVGFVDSNSSLGSTVFAFQGMIGLAYNVTPQFRLGIEGRYLGTTQPSVNVPGIGNVTYNNNNILALVGFTYKFAPSAEAPPPPPPQPQATSFMVFFDWDRSNLSQQALSTIAQAAQAFKTKGSARITATGHTDTSGPDGYNMALSLRRANAVKDALVRNGVPATAIAVVGVGKGGLLVPTPDGVREPQNRRVEIVLQ
jgi:outer membrane protein OmpA-like peptidoglycan-associated protein